MSFIDIDKANLFTKRIADACDEFGLAKEHRAGALFGWAYGQLRQTLTAAQARAVFEAALNMSEEKFKSEA